ncbi:MAG: hypothetical protein ABJK20_01930 [Halieaceae bacterium]
MLLTACKQPLVIFGEGDIVERLAGIRGCSLEEFQANSLRCAENEVIAEDYIVSYEAIPRPGWHFVGWTEGSFCKRDNTPLFCDLNITADFVQQMDEAWPGANWPPAKAVFSESGVLSTFTHKMVRNTGENLFSQLAYECSECSIAQQTSIVPPPGWQKGPIQVALPIAALLSSPSVEGEPDSVDFLPDVPGNEYRMIAVVRDGELLDSGGNGVMAVTEVERNTMFRYPANTRVHELTDPDGSIFVLFAYEVESEEFIGVDFQSADALRDDPIPVGWSYSTRILANDLVMHAREVATVLAIRASVTSTWQLR